MKKLTSIIQLLFYIPLAFSFFSGFPFIILNHRSTATTCRFKPSRPFPVNMRLSFSTLTNVGGNRVAVSYPNADTQVSTILKANKGKAGIYRWVNIKNGKSYIGSSKNLSVRLKQYYTTSFIQAELLKNSSYIYRAILKDGFSSFRLDILEYCDPAKVIEREQI